MIGLNCFFVTASLSLFAVTYAAPTPSSGPPIVSLGYSTFQGFPSANGTESFLGMPYAHPPVGSLRFHLPTDPPSTSGIIQATAPGNACPQQNFTLPVVQGIDYTPLQGILASGPSSEDCLYINVVRPAGISNQQQLPVVVWIYGGGFMNGDSAVYNGTQIVSRSAQLNQPIIYVSLNYRVNAFGFLGGQEVEDAGLGNLGLRDQHFALEWVNKNIGKFGGDPSKVTLWGQSAGSVSIAAHMVNNGGDNDGLFRAAIMQSGYTSPITSISEGKHQGFYDALVQQTNCNSPKSSSTLDCLRSVDYNILKAAIDTTPSLFSARGLNLTWSPSYGGGFLTESLKTSIRNGKYAKIPLLAGDVDDEGTLFSVALLNITTDAGFLDLVRTYWFGGMNESDIEAVGTAYPADPDAGSPFDTGEKYNLTTQYKRIAAFQGDVNFQSSRRSMLQTVSSTQNVWSYLSKAAKLYPFLGSVHGVDVSEFYGSGATPDYIGTDALINFVNNLDPNLPANAPASVPSGLKNFTWPMWNSNPNAPPMLQYNNLNQISLTNDTYRQEPMQLLIELSEQLGV